MEVKNKRTGGAKIVFAIAFLLFFAYAFSLILAFGWGFISSLKTIREYAKDPFGFPAELQFINYINAFRTLEFEGVTMPMMVWNSIWFSLGSVLLSLFFTALTAYVTSKYRFFGREFLYAFAVFMMIIPTYGTFVATYRLYHELQMVDSYTILLSATGGFTGMNYFLLYSYFKSISSSYSEAASLDGAGHYKIFFSIMMPMAKPMLISIFMLSFIGKWNDYMAPILYLPKKLTLASGLYKYQEIVMDSGDYPMLFAGLFISILPIFILFSVLHETMMTNMNIGGLKG